jgi:chitodextrinase
MAGRLRTLSFAVAAVLLGTGLGLATAADAGQVPTPTGVLLSQGRPVTASSTRSGFPARNVVDGKTSTRWVSKGGGTQWVAVDLGAVAPIVRVRLTWDHACARSYEVQTSPGGGGWTTVFRTTTGNGGVDDLTVSGSARQVRVLMTRRCTGSGYALRELQVYGPRVPPPPPGHPHVIEVHCTDVTLGWDPPGTVHPAAIEVFRDGQLVAWADGTATSVTVTGLLPNTAYQFYLEAVDADGTVSAPSAAIDVVMPSCGDPTPPTTPTGVHSTNVTSSCVTLAWNPSTDDQMVVGYRVYSGGRLVLETPTTSATVCGLAPATAYQFQVTAVDEAGNESLPSPTFVVVTGR